MFIKCLIKLFLLCFGVFNIVKVLPQKSIQDSNRAFALKIFTNIVSRNLKENIILSPFFIQRQMALIMYATNGETLNEIRNSTNLMDFDKDEILMFLQNYPKEFQSIERVYFADNLNLQRAFKNIAFQNFQTTTEKIKAFNVNNIISKINAYVNYHSNKRIVNFFDSYMPQSVMKLIFISAVFFQDQWEFPFKIEKTRPTKFYNWGKFEMNVNAMYTIQYAGYADLIKLQATALELSYKESDVKMLILLPNQGVSQNEWFKKLNSQNFGDIFEQLCNEIVAISLPTFHVEFGVDLAEPLTNLGMKTLYSQKADLSGAFQKTPTNLNPNIYHKTHLEVNEYGSDVNARKIQEITKKEANETPSLAPQKFFIVERPFVFLLHTDGIIHIIGRISVLNYPSLIGHQKRKNLQILPNENLLPKITVVNTETQPESESNEFLPMKKNKKFNREIISTS